MRDDIRTSMQIEVTGFSRPELDGRWVRLQLELGGKSAIGVFSIEDLADQPKRLHDIARQLGEPLITPAAKADLMRTVQQHIRDAQRDAALPTFDVVNRVGWHGKAFVTPTKVFQPQSDDLVVLLDDVPAILNYAHHRSLERWKEKFSDLLMNNSLFLFAASVALMPPLLELLDLDGCGFLFYGSTSLGKSTLLTFMGSVRGGQLNKKNGVQASWRRTVVMVEPLAIAANDGMLILDDIRNIPGDARARAAVAVEALYTMVGGTEKERKTNTQPARMFRLIAATSDNKSIRQLTAEGGVEFDASMTVRFIEIPVNREYGVFDVVPRSISPADYADAIRQVSHRYYGAPLHSFLKSLTKSASADRKTVVKALNADMSVMLAALGVDGTDGEKRRVADYFALAYAAGKLAVGNDVLPVTEAALRIAIIDVYRTHTEALEFIATDTDPLLSISNRLRRAVPSLLDLRRGKKPSSKEIEQATGYVTDLAEKKELVFTPRKFRELISHRFTLKRTCDALAHAGYLVRDTGNSRGSIKNQTKRRLGGKRLRVYCVSGRILKADRKST